MNLVSLGDTQWLVEQFRANMVIEGPISFEEDKWTTFRVAGEDDSLTLKVEGPCKRCSMVSVDQRTGSPVQEPFQALSKWTERNFQFGVLASVLDMKTDVFTLRPDSCVEIDKN